MPRFRAVSKRVYCCFLACILGQIILIWTSALAWIIPVGNPYPVYILQEPQEVLVRYRPEATFADIVNTYNNLGLNEVTYSPYNGIRRVSVPLTFSIYTIADTLNQNPVIAYAEPNYLRTAHFVPDDPLYKYQWHLNNPMMQQAWDLSIGENVIVAVLDSGIAHRNGEEYALAPDLANTNFMPGYDFVNDDPYPDDDNRHGTHIAGTIAQSTGNLYGCAGIAPGCTIMPIKVLDETGFGAIAGIVDGIYFAVNNGAQIINMSLGVTPGGKGRKFKSGIEEEAINYAVSEGVTVICSAGNESTDLPSYPSSYEATIRVTATKYDQSFADSYSNYGTDVDVCAPGGDMSEDVNGDGHPDGIYQQTHDGINYKDFDFYFAEGTSSSAAFVSGVVALILACANRPLTPIEVREILHSTAIDLGDPGWDQFYGWGLVNPLAAVQAALTPIAEAYFLPGMLYYYANTQFLNALTNATINPAPAPAYAINQVSYKIDANFESSGQSGVISSQLPSNQVINSYQTYDYFRPDLVTNGITTPSILGLLPMPYPFQSLFSSQSLLTLPQTSIVSNLYINPFTIWSLFGSYNPYFF